MADVADQKKGLTTFGWLVLGGVAATLLSNKDRREKLVAGIRGFAGRFAPGTTAPNQA